MRSRVYFVLGDIASNTTVGGLTAIATHAVVGARLHPVLAMGLGMLAGMFVAMASALIFVPLFGAFEVMLPSSLTGMLAGMLVAMLVTMSSSTRPLAGLTLAGAGVGVGLLVVAWTYYVTAREQNAS